MTATRLDSGEALYGSRWQRRRHVWLIENPLCKICQTQGRATPATVVDHITPHRGNSALFWDRSNWQSLCKLCHDGAKQSEEKKGFSKAVDADGWPIDARHPVNASGRNTAPPDAE